MVTSTQSFAFYLALNVLVFVVLAARVIVARWQYKVGLGDGDQPELQRRIRAHGNAAEFMPMGLIVLGALALMPVSVWWVHGLGATFTIGRVFHAIGLSKTGGVSIWRTLGMILSFSALALGAGMALTYALS